ncbi:DUF1289 domain-containing protein, partial [Vibrio parahaemolyticus]
KMLAGKTKPEQLQDNSSPQQDLF